MRALVLGMAIVFASASLATADDVMAGYYGNTIIAKTATSELHIHYKADHNFDAQGTSAKGPIALKGTWTFDAKLGLCRTYDPALPSTPNPVCTPFEPHAVGDNWQMPNVALTLVKGIQ